MSRAQGFVERMHLVGGSRITRWKEFRWIPMFRRSTAIFLFMALTSSNAAAATALCADLSKGGADQIFKRHCKMTQETWVSMVCCPHQLGPSEASDCCKISAPPPDLPGPALPATSTEDFGLQTLLQLLNSSEPVPAATLTQLLARCISLAVSFCPDRSDTYRLASTFRI
jgi:hypothetical protein